jgi:hypothetical protein
MTDAAKSISPVLEITSLEVACAWPVIPAPDFEERFLPLNDALNDNEMGAVMCVACSYNQVEFQATPGATLRLLMEADGFVLPGGLQFSENNIAKVVPGCCCGLENWYEWLAVPDGNRSLWLGHDPSPWVDYVEGSIRVWPDENCADNSFIEFSPQEMTTALAQAQVDLQRFLVRLRQWAQHITPECANDLSVFFARHLHIQT